MLATDLPSIWRWKARFHPKFGTLSTIRRPGGGFPCATVLREIAHAKARIRRTLLTKLCLGFMPHIMPRTGFWPVRRRSPRDHSLCIAFRGVVMHWLHQSTQKAYQDVVANELSHFASSKVPAPAKFGTLERLNPNKSAAKSGYHPATGNAGNLCARASLMAGCMETEIRFRRPFPER